MDLRWVQISDIHYSQIDYQTKRMRTQLFELLKKIRTQGKIGCLFITGDITDKNSNYDEAVKNFIKELVSILEIDDYSKVFILPGNHDIDRKIPDGRENLLKDMFSNYDNYNTLNKKIISLKEQLIEAQKKFFAFYKEIKGNGYPENKIHFITEVSDKINVVNLNTSWLCGFDGEDENLFLSVDSLFDCLEENKQRLLEADMNIAIGHHNMDCYNKEEKSELLNLFRDYNIDFYLSGHIHDSSAIYHSESNTHLIVCNQMKADEMKYYGGFTVGNISDRKCFIEFYKWHGEGNWAVDTNVGTILRDGKYKLESGRIIPKNTGKDLLIIHKTMGTPPNEIKMTEDLLLDIEDCDIRIYQHINLNISSEEEWYSQKKETEIFYNEIKNIFWGKHVYICSLSHIPLLIYFGHLIGNGSEVIISQHDEILSKWVLYEKNAEIIPLELVKFDKKEHQQSKKLVISVSVSGEVKFESINESVDVNECDVLQLSIKDPILHKVLYTNQVQEIKNNFYKITNDYIGGYDEVHLFYAGPAGLAVEIGRCIRENMWPKVTLYNYRRNNTPSYQMVFSINE